MNKDVLQERINEYNFITSELLTKIRKNLYNIEEGFIKSQDYYNSAELKDLKNNLEELYQWQLRVASFIDGYSVARGDNDPEIKYVVVMREVLPKFPAHLKDKLIKEYDLNYFNFIAAEIYT